MPGYELGKLVPGLFAQPNVALQLCFLVRPIRGQFVVGKPRQRRTRHESLKLIGL